MQLEELEHSVELRRNRIFLLMEEVRRLRIQQRIKVNQQPFPMHFVPCNALHAIHCIACTYVAALSSTMLGLMHSDLMLPCIVMLGGDSAPIAICAFTPHDGDTQWMTCWCDCCC